MTFDAELWLQVAEVCCIPIPEVDREALLRTAVNRAYFAALLSVKLRIEAAQGNGTVPRWQTHESILQAVRTGGAPFRTIHAELERLRRFRARVDYELEGEPLMPDVVHKEVRAGRRLIRNQIKALPEAMFRRLSVPRG
ncbi:MAG TPA: hypothetical protein VF092_28040 [Longimicrobium sp.]